MTNIEAKNYLDKAIDVLLEAYQAVYLLEIEFNNRLERDEPHQTRKP